MSNGGRADRRGKALGMAPRSVRLPRAMAICCAIPKRSFRGGRIWPGTVSCSFAIEAITRDKAGHAYTPVPSQKINLALSARLARKHKITPQNGSACNHQRRKFVRPFAEVHRLYQPRSGRVLSRGGVITLHRTWTVLKTWSIVGGTQEPSG